MSIYFWPLLVAPILAETIDLTAPHCPPPLPERVVGCRRSIHENRGIGILARSLFDHAARVVIPLLDIIELAPEAPDENLLMVLAFVHSVLHLLCVTDFSECYPPSIRHDIFEYACEKVQKLCMDVGMCNEVGYVCQTFVEDVGASLGFMLEDLMKFVAGVAEERGMNVSRPAWQLKGSPVEPCVATTPKRRLLLNFTLVELEQGREFHARHRILELTSSNLLPSSGLASYVINLGASYVDGCLDSANCLVEQGWPGVLLEVDHERADALRKRYVDHHQVQILSNLVRPTELPASVLSAIWNKERSLPHRDSLFPMFLKIDVDNGDCDYLEAWLSTGYLPLFIEVELIQSFVPPSLEVSIPFSLDVLDPALGDQVMGTADATVLNGCSLGAVLALLKGQYSLFSWSYDKEVNAQFVHTSWAHEHNLTAVLPEDIDEFWYHAIGYRELWDDHTWHGLEFPVTLMTMQNVPIDEKRRLLLDSWKVLRAYLAEGRTRPMRESTDDNDFVRVRGQSSH